MWMEHFYIPDALLTLAFILLNDLLKEVIFELLCLVRKPAHKLV